MNQVWHGSSTTWFQMACFFTSLVAVSGRCANSSFFVSFVAVFGHGANSPFFVSFIAVSGSCVPSSFFLLIAGSSGSFSDPFLHFFLFFFCSFLSFL